MMTLKRSTAIGLLLASALTAGCRSSAPAPIPRPTPSGAALDGVLRIAVVTTGESRFAAMQGSGEPDRAFDDVMKWLPYKDLLVPIARAVYSGVTYLINSDRTSTMVPKDVSPGAVVAEAFARTLQAIGPFNSITPLEREPVGDLRRDTDAIVRLSVPSWGLMRVREGKTDHVAGFADVRAHMVLRDSGVVVWEHEEDVTHPERLALDAYRRDRALTRQALMDVLERAGRRLGNELVYARNAGR